MILELIHQHPDHLKKEKIRAEEKRKENEIRKSMTRARGPFEGICTSMNRNDSHTKTYRKTARALIKV